MLAANAEFNVGTGGAATLSGEFNQLAHAVLVEGDEGILLENALLFIMLDETSCIVAADAEGSLREVVGAEAEELGMFSDVTCAQCGTGQFDHRADHIVDAGSRSGEHFFRHIIDYRFH